MKRPGMHWYTPRRFQNLPPVGEHVLASNGELVCEAYRKPSGLWVRADGTLLPGIVQYWHPMLKPPGWGKGAKK